MRKKYCFWIVILFSILSHQAFTQSNPNFNVTLRLDFSSIDALIDLREGKIANVQQAAELRGNQIAAATSALLARKSYSSEEFLRELERFRSGTGSSFDIFGLNPALSHLQQIKTLLEETKKRNLDRKIVSTIEQFFPRDSRITASIPVYFVALGNENAAAFVRSIAWEGNIPHFVGDGNGELTIVVNLSRSPQYIQEVQLQFVDMMSTLAHETFHVVFGLYQNSSPAWQQIHTRRDPSLALAELVQNEGIAYLISLQQHGGASLSEQQLAAAKRTIDVLNSALKELGSPSVSPERARDLIMNSNLSGSYEGNYGATAGLLMAYAIDAKLGRESLTETIRNGVGDFFEKYSQLTQQFGELPKFDTEVVKELHQ
ncbi:MAG: hypothetical protein PHP42_05895 [Bacteroidota bacterium]|nr:hypothetical protein [Bacteroidota bacterium]